MGTRQAASNGGGLGFASVLTIVFVVLKLTGSITWPWIWVLSPIWISVALALIVLGIFLVVLAVLRRKELRRPPRRF